MQGFAEHLRQMRERYISHSEESIKLTNHLVEGVNVEMLASIKYLSWDGPNNLMIKM